MVERLDAAKRAELERLRAEFAIRSVTATSASRRPGHRWRAVASAVLLGLGSLLAPVALTAAWTHRDIADTDRFVADAGPLLHTSSIRTVLADTVLTCVDVRGTAGRALDAWDVRRHVRTRVGRLIASEPFVAGWDGAVRAAHQRALNVLSGNTSAAGAGDGEVSLDLAPMVAAVRQSLVASGFAVTHAAVPAVHPTIALVDAGTLARAGSAYRLLNAVATWAGGLALALLAAGIALARNRRTAVCNGGIGVAVGMALLAAALIIVRVELVRRVPEAAAVAAGDWFDVLVRFLRTGLRALFALGVVAALGAEATGPSPWAVRMRRWVRAFRTPLTSAALAVAGLVFVFLDRPDGVAVLAIAAALGLCVALIQFLARPG